MNETSAGQGVVLGEDPTCEGVLALVPLQAAQADTRFNRALYGRTTMGEVRSVAGVLDILEDGWSTAASTITKTSTRRGRSTTGPSRRATRHEQDTGGSSRGR